MSSTILRDFIANGALLIVLSAVHLHLGARLERRPAAIRSIASGVAFGLTAAAGMLIPVTISPGVIFDARALLLAAAGCYGGPWAAAVASAIAAAARLGIGGIGAAPGAIGCFMAASVGIAWWFWRGRRNGPPPLWAMPFIGLAAAAMGVLSVFLLPADLAWQVVETAAPVSLAMQPAGALLLGWLFGLQERLRRVERQARASAERFRDFSESAGDWLWEMDADLRFTGFSPSFDKIGLDPSPLIGKRRDEVGCWTEPPEAMEGNFETMRARLSFADFRFFAPRPDGSIACVSSSGKPIFDESGAFVGYRGVSRDVTALARAEARERIANERFRDFAEAAGDWYWEMGPDLRFTYVSPAIERSTGHAPSFYIGKRRAELFSPEERRGPLAAHLATLDRREPFRDFRYSRVEPGGRRRTYSSSGKPVHDSSGGFIGYRGVGSDVTEIEEQKARAARADRLFRDSIDSLEEGLIKFGPDGRVIAVNRAISLIYPDLADVLRPGVAYEAIVRATLDRMVIEVPASQREAWVRQRLAEWGSDSGEREQQLGDGRWIRFTDRRTPSGGVVSIRVDITHIKARERQLAERTEQLRVSLEGIEEGVSVLDADLRLVSWNEVFVRLTGASSSALYVGMPCEELIRLQAEHGLFGPTDDPDELTRRRMEQVRRREPRDELLHRAGRVVQLRRRPMKSGGYITTFRDVTEEHRRAEELTRRASRDPLTGLANRTSLEEALDEALAKRDGEPVALLFIDLDGFKQVNDEIGHEAGDRVLREVARRIAGSTRPEDLPARLGGDEFVVLLSAEAALRPEAIVARVHAALAAPIDVGDGVLVVSASIGIARARDHDDRDSLLRAADGEMYRAKRAARSGARSSDAARRREVA